MDNCALITPVDPSWAAAAMSISEGFGPLTGERCWGSRHTNRDHFLFFPIAKIAHPNLLVWLTDLFWNDG